MSSVINNHSLLIMFVFCIFFFYCYGDHRDLHSFPTRRSSDLLGFVKMENEVSGYPLDPDATGLVNPNFAMLAQACGATGIRIEDRKSTRLNSSHVSISYAVFCLKKKKNKTIKSI